MPLHLAWKSPYLQQADGVVAGERYRLLRLRQKRPARNHLPLTIGTRVLYMDEPGCVIALNIAAMGRWPAHLYPFLVLLDCGLVVRCHAADLDVDVASESKPITTQALRAAGNTQRNTADTVAGNTPGKTTGKPESTMWY